MQSVVKYEEKKVPHKFLKLYQKTGWDDFNNELRVTESTLNEDTSCRVTSESDRKGCFIRRGHTNECHKTHNGWYLGILILVRTYEVM